MKTRDMDNELKTLIKGIKLDSPGNDFTSAVMNRVFEEKAAMEKVTNEKLLGKGFWIILLLFILLFVAMFVFSSSATESGSVWSKLFSSAETGALSQGYKSFFSNVGSLPLSIGGILFASSILVFIDRFLPQIMPHHSPQESF
jgi:uncharacterized membrane protein